MLEAQTSEKEEQAVAPPYDADQVKRLVDEKQVHRAVATFNERGERT